MAYVITYGHAPEPREISCETAAEALDIVLRLNSEGHAGIMVSGFEAADEAVETLRQLASR